MYVICIVLMEKKYLWKFTGIGMSQLCFMSRSLVYSNEQKVQFWMTHCLFHLLWKIPLEAVGKNIAHALQSNFNVRQTLIL